MTDETKEWAWEAGVLYENGVPLATATQECSVLNAQMIVAAPTLALRVLANLENGHRRDCPHSLRRYRAVAVPCSEDCEADRAALARAGFSL